MNLNDIKKIIARISEGGAFTVSAENLARLDAAGTLLKDTFGTETLLLTGVRKGGDGASFSGASGAIRFFGETFSSCYVTFSFSEDGGYVMMKAVLKLPEPFDPLAGLSGVFTVEYTEFSARIDECAKKTWTAIAAAIKFRKLALPVLAESAYGSGRWMLDTVPGEMPAHSLSLADIATLAGADDVTAILPPPLRELTGGLRITDIRVVFNMDAVRVESFEILTDVRCDKRWEITKGLSLGNLRLGLTVYNYDELFAEVSIGASVELPGFSAPLPVFVRLSSDDISLQLGGQDRIRLNSLALLESFIDNAQIETLIPAGYTPGELYLDCLFLMLNADSGVECFSLSVGMSNILEFPGYFKLEEIGLDYATDYLALSGSVTFGLLKFYARMTKKDADWEVYAEINTREPAKLSDLPFVPADTPLPPIGLNQLVFAYERSGGMRFYAEAFFLSGDACRFSMEVTWGEKKKTIALELTSDPALFNLTNFLRAVGYDAFTLPEGLDVSLEQVRFSYDLFTKRLEFQTETGSGGRLYYMSDCDEKEQRRHICGLLVKMNVGFADLPVVGGMVPGLGTVGVHDFKAVAVSQDMPGLEIPDILEKADVARGLYLAMALTLPDKPLQIWLPLAADSPNALDNAAGNKSGIAISIDKNIGPFALRKLHIGYAEGILTLGVSAALAEGPLTFEMDGLCIGFDTASRKVSFALTGLSVGLETGTLTISGGFLRRDEYTYNGSLLLKMGGFSLTAVGSYATSPCKSVFVFAVLKGQLGGPPCFFVTGIAAGFGYNRGLNIPRIEEMDNFPLLRAAQGKLSTEDIFKEEKTFFPAKAGSNWFAAGVLFNSFKLVDSIAVLTVLLEDEPQINLLGRSVLTVPFNAQNPVAYAVLLLKVSVNPSSSLVAVDAVLSSESYVLSKNCKLTGAFAFYTWYGGDRAGDFVLTLGGYHSSYRKPAHYPDVRRLGINWRISGNLSVTGSMYFALTPSCVMAGGSLSMTFSVACVEAWVNARLDMYIRWKPFFYDIFIGINIGCKVDLWLFTVRLEVGCDLHIWGPEFSGIATVHLWCISFDIPLGAGTPPSQQDIDTGQFISSFLPSAKDSNAGGYAGCSVQAWDGLLKETGEAQKVWSVCADRLVFVTRSITPANTVTVNGHVDAGIPDRPALYLRPCGKTLGQSVHDVHIVRANGAAVDTGRLAFEGITENVPAALWVSKGVQGETVPAYTGLLIRAKQAEYFCITFKEGFNAVTPDALLPRVPSLPAKTYTQSDAYKEIAKLTCADTAKNRNSILEDMGESAEGINLTQTAIDPAAVFCESPALANIGGKVYER